MEEDPSLFTHQPCEYAPLPTPSSIRLFSFVDRREGAVVPSICDTPLLECQLSLAKFNERSKYKALSYTWGHPIPPGTSTSTTNSYASVHRRPIILNKRLAYITKSLYGALQHLSRLHERFLEGLDFRTEPYNTTWLIEAVRGAMSQPSSTASAQAPTSPTRMFLEKQPCTMLLRTGIHT